MSSCRRRVRWTVILGAVAVIVAASRLEIRGPRRVGFEGTGIELPEMCSFHRATGLDCPGCGMTRSFISLAHGELRAAARYHPLGLLLFPLVVLQIPWQLAQLVREYRGLPPWRVWRGRRRLTFVVVSAAVVTYIAFGFGRLVWQMTG